MISPETVKKIKGSDWDEVEQHFKDCIRLLDSVSDIEENEDHEKVARGKKYAIKVVQAILEPFDVEDITDETSKKELTKRLGL